jgi:mono/diheme cytochrome c family protein
MRPLALAALAVLAACAPPPASLVSPFAPAAHAQDSDRADPASPMAGSPTRGQALVVARCASCHATGQADESPLAAAPAFRDLQRRYPVEDLAEALAEGIDTAHPAMPEFAFEPAEIADLIAYLHTLKASEPRPTDSSRS